jgi:hypothetical protein
MNCTACVFSCDWNNAEGLCQHGCGDKRSCSIAASSQKCFWLGVMQEECDANVEHLSFHKIREGYMMIVCSHDKSGSITSSGS